MKAQSIYTGMTRYEYDGAVCYHSGTPADTKNVISELEEKREKSKIAANTSKLKELVKK